MEAKQIDVEGRKGPEILIVKIAAREKREEIAIPAPYFDNILIWDINFVKTIGFA